MKAIFLSILVAMTFGCSPEAIEQVSEIVPTVPPPTKTPSIFETVSLSCRGAGHEKDRRNPEFSELLIELLHGAWEPIDRIEELEVDPYESESAAIQRKAQLLKEAITYVCYYLSEGCLIYLTIDVTKVEFSSDKQSAKIWTSFTVPWSTYSPFEPLRSGSIVVRAYPMFYQFNSDFYTSPNRVESWFNVDLSAETARQFDVLNNTGQMQLSFVLTGNKRLGCHFPTLTLVGCEWEVEDSNSSIERIWTWEGEGKFDTAKWKGADSWGPEKGFP